MLRSDRRWAAVVVRPQVTWLAAAVNEDVTHRRTLRRWVAAAVNEDVTVQHRPTVHWALDEWAALVEHAATRWFASEGVVLVQPTAGPAYVEAMLVKLETEAKAAGWRLSDVGRETGWFTMTHTEPDRAIVHLGVGPIIAQHRTSLFRLFDPADTIVRRLALYHALTGAAWRGTAGMSGCAAIRNIQEPKRSGQPLWRWDRAPEDVIGAAFELRGRREPDAEDMACKYVHHFDIRSMYLAAAINAMVGWSAPERRGPQEFDPKRAGYWLVRQDQLVPAELVTHVVHRHHGELVWLTTPVMTWLAELGIRPEVMDSLTADKTGRYLRAWGEQLHTALIADTAFGLDIGRAVKDTYARTVGMLARPGGRVYRPDWRDEVVDRARVNMLRKVHKAGVKPLRFNNDSIWVATDLDADALGVLLGAGPEIGKFRHEDTTTPQEYAAAVSR